MKQVFLTILLALSTVLFTFGETENTVIRGTSGSKLQAVSFGHFDEPWAMTFLPDGRLLVTEKSGILLLVDLMSESRINVQGVPDAAYGGQGGLGDVILHPGFTENNVIYLSYAEKERGNNRRAAVLRAVLKIKADEAKLEEGEVIWRQTPAVSGSGHYSHRLAFSPEGKLFITSGDRQLQSPAQNWTGNLGKVIRLNDDGSVPEDNPFQNRGDLARTFWSIGHRNLLGIAFDKTGRLWTHEMGPRHGDEFNLTLPGENYGWPLVSWGDQYSGQKIPDHDTRPEFHAPEAYWVPTIAPSGLIIYGGSLFPEWQGNAFIGGLRSEALIRVVIEGEQAREEERFAMGKRIREVEEGPDGALWVLEDRKGARLLKLTPVQ
ncbi:MAG: PQQ-dependent sugar dehydrogenase [Spirochaetales bacterium]|nr:PQQ-dependent sugar dehydrogenase [Spirochaetales bacterium]